MKEILKVARTSRCSALVIALEIVGFRDLIFFVIYTFLKHTVNLIIEI